jgi:hypothetical protein
MIDDWETAGRKAREGLRNLMRLAHMQGLAEAYQFIDTMDEDEMRYALVASHTALRELLADLIRHETEHLRRNPEDIETAIENELNRPLDPFDPDFPDEEPGH